MASKQRILFPHDNVAIAFLKFFGQFLAKSKFEKNFERMDPGSVDMYRFHDNKEN